MNLQEKLISLSEYKLGFNIYNGHVVININYPTEWTIIKPEDDDITFAQENSIYYYSAPIIQMQNIFEVIETTIEFNKEMEKKLELFKLKQKELQEIFAEESYEILETLSFTLKKKKKVAKKTPKKEDVKMNNEIIQDTQNNEDSKIELNNTENIDNNEEIIITNKDLDNGIY